MRNDASNQKRGLSEPSRGMIRQMARYLIVGCSSAAIEYAAFAIMLYAFGIGIAVSSPLALLISTVFNFALSSTWSFKGSTNMARSAALYTLLFAFNLAFSSFAGGWLVGIGIPDLVAKLVTMCCVTAWNFVLYRKVIFV